MEKSKVAVFIDVENLTHWVKNDGTERLMADISSIGQVIVRRAYGVWSKPGIVNFQAPLNRLGFELIHSYHPVSGKNSADIQLTVDVMEHALHLPDVEWFVLATGDSDFSPLFRRLREMGKEVIGVGPRSPLSESVKSSCSRYIHTDPIEDNTRELEFDDAVEIVESILSASSEPLALTVLKQGLFNVNSAFNEKAMGFSSFSAFLKSIDTVSMHLAEGSNTIWMAELVMPDAQKSNHEQLEPASRERYQTLLRKKKWISVPIDLLELVHKKLCSMPPLDKQEMIEWLVVGVARIRPGVTAADIRKAVTIFFKTQLFNLIDDNKQDTRLMKFKQDPKYLEKVDIALLHRLYAACEESGVVVDQDTAQTLLYKTYERKDLKVMLQQIAQSSSG
ncbi:NYN domain-containing protein [Marinobacterium stanieri]|uniref:NYN domain-containing protein n=1 Tax=Marinobacterium stanieri TaxID=49186 RepID=UPI003A95CFE6